MMSSSVLFGLNTIGFVYYFVPIIILYSIFKLDLTRVSKAFISSFILSLAIPVLNFTIVTNFESELYIAYITPIMNDKIPLINWLEPSMPLFNTVVIFFKKLSELDIFILFQIIRMTLFFFYLYGIYLIYSLSFYRFKNDYDILLLLVLASLDFNVSYLLIGDQFRNFLGQVFFVYFIYNYFKFNKFFSHDVLIFAFAAMLSHKMYVLFIPIVVIMYLLFTKYNIYQSINKIISISVISILFVLSFQKLSSYIVIFGISFHDKFNTFAESGFSLLSNPGVVGQIILHFIMILFWMINFKKLDLKIRFFLFISLFFLIVARSNILGVSFVEPNRVYMILSFFMIIVTVASIIRYLQFKKEFYLPTMFVLFFILYNLATTNLANQSLRPQVVIFQKSVLNIMDYYGSNLEVLIYSFSFVSFILILNVVKKSFNIKGDLIHSLVKVLTLFSLFQVSIVIFTFDVTNINLVSFFYFFIIFISWKFVSHIISKKQGARNWLV